MINDAWFKDGKFIIYKRLVNETYQIANVPGIADTAEGPVPYEAGWYLCISPTGHLYPLSAEKFNLVKIDLGDGICIRKKIIKWAKIADHSGFVDTSWGEKLPYIVDEDIIVRHGPNDYGVIKITIFDQNYERI